MQTTFLPIRVVTSGARNACGASEVLTECVGGWAGLRIHTVVLLSWAQAASSLDRPVDLHRARSSYV